MTRPKSIRLVAARNEARSLIRSIFRDLSRCLWKWLRIEFTVWRMLRRQPLPEPPKE